MEHGPVNERLALPHSESHKFKKKYLLNIFKKYILYS
jgi:hypothetical protein